MTTEPEALKDDQIDETLPTNPPRHLIVEGPVQLRGEARVAGAKNAMLPIMAASLLTDEPVIIDNTPHLDDVALMAQVLAGIGVKPIIHSASRIELGGGINSCTVPARQATQLRASILTLGPMLTRFGEARLPYPGGCSIGPRPVDQHLQALRTLGAVIDERDTEIVAHAPKGLTGAEIRFDHPTVGGTENIMMAAVGASGTTVIHNCAVEPEVQDLARCLQKMGASISGVGSKKLVIKGQKKMHGCCHRIISDRIESGSYLAAAAASRGSVTLIGARAEHLQMVLQKLQEAGAEIEIGNDYVKLDMKNKRPKAVDIETQPYPGFPTDMQAQFTALNAVAEGSSTITENIFPNRTAHILEMCRMGAKLRLENNRVHVEGVERLVAATVYATDLRASASLVIAALVAEGKSNIHSIEHMDRGYEWLSEKLGKLGAPISRKLG